MDKILHRDAMKIIKASIAGVLPDRAVSRALSEFQMPAGKLILISIGKAGWQMASAACRCLTPDAGIVITKYGHVQGPLPGIECFEAGHPIPDQNGFEATEKAIRLVSDLTAQDTVLFLLSGGGSALFEKPLIPVSQLQALTARLLASGAGIREINTVRKHLSGVKGGRFGALCEPAGIYAVVLSDVLGDPLDMIASGPVTPDSSTCREAMEIAERYGLELSNEAIDLLQQEPPKTIPGVKTVLAGNVARLCAEAEKACRRLGYEPVFLTDRLCCEARDAGSFLGSILRSHARDKKNLAFIAGGETVVHLRGTGLGGRSQELVLSAALQIQGLPHTAVFSVGSDGTDGPTDAAGGYADGDTVRQLLDRGMDPQMILEDNDSYHGLDAVGGLIRTGPTGTNVNDLTVGLLRSRQ